MKAITTFTTHKIANIKLIIFIIVELTEFELTKNVVFDKNTKPKNKESKIKK